MRAPAQLWTQAVAALGGDAARAAADGIELERRYAEPHRRYHNAAHVVAVARDGEWLAEELMLSAGQRAHLLLAACAHDVVYDAVPGADEAASAAWALAALASAGVADDDAARVAELVRSTESHIAVPGDDTEAALLDADLAVLGSAPAAYARYVEAVRAEYAAIDDAGWRQGRAAVLRSLLAPGRIYLTAPARHRFEASARRNIADELTGLAPPP